MRFGIEVPQDAPFPALVERWQRAEEMGFDYLCVADHSADTRTNLSGDYRNLDGTWFDGLTVLAVMAKETNRIRIGTLVSNPILRPPALLAKEALTVDHLCGGRLELGIGMGIEPLDHTAMGIAYWSPQERAARFSEYVEVVDGLLSTPSRAYVFEGRYYHTRQAAMGQLLSFLLAYLGWALFGVTDLWAQVYPRIPIMLLVVSAASAGLFIVILVGEVLSLPGSSFGVVLYTYRVVDIVFNVAIAWLGFALFSGRVRADHRH